MKNIIAVFALVTILFALVSCTKEQSSEYTSNPDKTKLITIENAENIYNQLPETTKKEIDFNYESIDIDKVVLKESMGNILDKTYIDKEVLSLSFIIRNKNIRPNNRIVFATIEDFKYIGNGYVD